MDKLSIDVTHHNKLDTPDATQVAKSQRRCSNLMICEVLLLTPVLLTILGLFLIPTVYYAAYNAAAENLENVTIPAPDGSNQFICSEGFFFDENETRLCRPICGEINPKHIGLQVLENVAICVCFIASVLMFILALTVQRDSL